MNVASLELCKELYELSGWRKGETFGKTDWWTKQDDGEEWDIGLKSDTSEEFHSNLEYIAPAYDAGFLLRKLPKRISVGNHRAALEFCTIADLDNSSWYAQYVGAGSPKYYQWADTPEDTLAKLAIELFKSGVLKKGQE